MKKALVELVFSDAADLLGQLNVPTEILDRELVLALIPKFLMVKQLRRSRQLNQFVADAR